MNNDQDHKFAVDLDRELKDLPELAAPDTLIPNVMDAIRSRATSRVRWYQQPWPRWPVGLQTASLLVLLALFAGLCHVGWRVYHGESVAMAWHGISEWIASWRVFASAITSLVTAATLVFKKLGMGFFVFCLIVAACSYAACVGLGTAFMRFILFRRPNSI